MKIGLSAYSLFQAISAGEMAPLETFDWIAANGGEQVEVATVGFSLHDDPGLPETMRERAAALGLEISSYTIGAQFIQPTPEAFEAEIERVVEEVEIAARLGVKVMRHDVASRPASEATLAQLAYDMPSLVEACRRIADAAAPRGIVTTVENHGFHLQQSDRVEWLIRSVDRPNFRMTLDIGNFLCVDEDPMAAVRRCLPFASLIHAKDFYHRPASFPGEKESWFQTRGGNFLRGAIVGHGDLDIAGILNLIKSSGYDGNISIEFEGVENCRLGSRLGMLNARHIWDRV